MAICAKNFVRRYDHCNRFTREYPVSTDSNKSAEYKAQRNKKSGNSYRLPQNEHKRDVEAGEP